MMNLLAKSRGPKGTADAPTVAEHCANVHEAAVSVWKSIEPELCSAIGRSREDVRSSILLLYEISSLLHDVGKANSAFQPIVSGSKRERKRQPVRHEILGGVLLCSEHFWGRWLSQALDDRERLAAAWAIAGHHLELRRMRPDENENPVYRSGDTPKTVLVYTSHAQVSALLGKCRGILSSAGRDPGEPPVCADPEFDTVDDRDCGLEQLVKWFVKVSDGKWTRLRTDDRFKENLALLKALLIAADVAGSALLGENEPPADWICRALSRRLRPQDLQPIIDESLKGRKPYRFQQNVAASPSRVTVVAAGCGNGKTTAAYMWAQKWGAGRKLFFAYPTTGTASAGFEDYLFTQTQLERDLIHSRAGVDLRAMYDSPESPAIERAQRVESLRAWGQQAIACTVDTVLGLIQNQRRPLYAFPSLACGAFVFDEVHSYDRRLFAELLRFLDVFRGVPALIMSASIPPARLSALRCVLGDRMNAEIIPGDAEFEEVKRYRLKGRASADDCWPEVETELHRPAKVLWVCNTVKDAVRVFRDAKDRLPHAEIFLYHSRYRYVDRVRRQKDVIAEFAFEGPKRTRRTLCRPALTVATQVCEMSLNISADLLVTSLCPLPSLVQRLGRLNRYTVRDRPRRCLVYPFSGRPYHSDESRDQMEAAQRMIKDLCGGAIGQTALAGFVNGLDEREDWSEELYSAWIDGGWQSEPLPPRDTDNSVTIIREEDWTAAGRPLAADRVVDLTIPMLFKPGFSWNLRAGGYIVAPSGTIEYDAVEGASWGN